MLLVEKHCPWARAVHIVTPDPAAARAVLAAHRVRSCAVIHADRDVAPANALRLAGWFRQQYVKLHADLVCGAEQVVCIGADTLVLDPIGEADLYRDDRPVLRFFGSDERVPHLRFERIRVLNVAAQLAAAPARTLLPGDFICDLFPMTASHLRALRSHLDRLHGSDGLTRILSRLGQPRCLDNRTGEWTMYAVFVIDVLRDGTPLQLADPDWACQIHTANDLAHHAPYTACIIHFVHEPGGTEAVLAALDQASRL